MMRTIFLSFFLALFILSESCDGSRSEEPVPVVRDTAITPEISYSEMFFDSLDLEKFISAKKIQENIAAQIRDFYKVRNYQFAWFTEEKINEQAIGFWNLQSNYIAQTGDSSIYNPFLQALSDSISSSGELVIMDSIKALPYELEMTRQFFVYAVKAYVGDQHLNPKDLKWFIPRRKADLRSMLDSLMVDPGSIGNAEPVNRQYALLRNYLVKYNKIKSEGGWETVDLKVKKLVEGDSSSVIPVIKRRLRLVGDYMLEDTSKIFNDSLTGAVKKFQGRYGLKQDGVIGGNTLKEMNQSLDRRIRQILINMERLKWVPAEPKGDYVLVNIPAFKLFVFEDGQVKFNMNVVVGDLQHHTVIFTGKMKHVVFSPYWNVPNGIMKNEVLPAIKRNPNYLESHDMEWNGGRVRQRPGPRNSLGLVKFLFPNSYDIYLHDTPSKSLFNESKRTFSHGCIRIAQPQRLAEWIFRNDSTITRDKIVSYMNAGKEKWVNVPGEVTVFIGYFTAWVDGEGNINFRDDVYGHDKVMGEAMMGEGK